MTIGYPNGIGASTGDALAIAKPLIISGNVWYVQSTTGTDAASPAGKNREKPLATLAQAITNAADDDIIVCLSAHAETLTAMQTIGKRLTIIGEGSSSGVPTVTFTNNQSNATMFDITGVSVQLRNLKFPANAQASTAARITSNVAKTRIVGCYFQCGATDTGPAVALGANATHCDIVNTTFISTATSSSAQPESGLKMSGATLTDIRLDGVVFSAGTVGFSNPYACDLSNAVSRIYAENLSLLLGADMKLGSTSTGYVNIQTCTGGSRLDW